MPSPQKIQNDETWYVTPHCLFLRFWARTLDNSIAIFVGGLVAVFMGFDVAEKSSRIVLAVTLLGLWVPIEAMLLSALGTTPGKALFKLKIAMIDSRRPTYSTALGRSFRVWMQCLGFGIPIVSLITMILACTRIRDLGKSSWDEECGTEVLHKRVTRGRAALIILLFVVIIAFLAFLDSL
jgi:hypothetical protein